MSTLYLPSVIKHLESYKSLADKTFSQLSETDFWFIPGKESNCIAVIIQHMSGNMLSRWTNFLTEDGEKTWRRRDEEFETVSSTRENLIMEWEKGWTCMFDSLQQLRSEDLAKTVYIRSEPHQVIDAINRQLAHYSYHVGQIVFIGKMIKGDKWVSLSIQKGRSAEFNKLMADRDKTNPGLKPGLEG
jgi:hypothetical protein